MQFSRLVSAAAFLALSAATNITIAQPGVPFVVNDTLPPSFAFTDGASIVDLFLNVDSSTTWNLISKTHLQGDTGEPEGMVRVGDDRIFVSSGQYTVATEKYNRTINGTDRTAGAGYAHMLVYDGQGGLIANATLTRPGDIEYHAGGIDYDGRYIWIPLAQYRPNSTATIVRLDPLTLEVQRLFAVDDHNGGVVHDTIADTLVTLNWNARNATTWSFKDYPSSFAPLPLFTPPEIDLQNPSFFVDYQDCKFIGHHVLPSQLALARNNPYGGQLRPLMFCSGVATITSGDSSYPLGGLALVDLETATPLWEVPIGILSDLGVSIAENPVDVSVVDGKLRVYFIPDQHNSTLYVYEAN
ncbi:hypothetical protein ASPZODRAFT_61126 [Penicilliopsis zonata CBS 506.65]|uniref:SMP-30/Gluconolactonase/LRE-like region domain-containing protein n=1 Tax=Penicilliopsis zonata CBS 506.65 TaxID=1073090 RepID=A0A1L9SNX0_9EURO|nr:hypothetical protein ASPZODRAFT_61126 [Penicilliopsis zonata CBS 506.65]OJJ48952.1 hypothetical protein ASPZODRAFT_61126 [Penicilliopsis zonata CBS 506.65]